MPSTHKSCLALASAEGEEFVAPAGPVLPGAAGAVGGARDALGSGEDPEDWRRYTVRPFPPPRTNRTSLIPPLVLSGHAAIAHGAIGLRGFLVRSSCAQHDGTERAWAWQGPMPRGSKADILLVDRHAQEAAAVVAPVYGAPHLRRYIFLLWRYIFLCIRRVALSLEVLEGLRCYPAL